MKFQYLAESLVPAALAAKKFFAKTEGAIRFQAEPEVAPGLSYRPTLLATMQDKSLLAVEVNEGQYSGALDTFVVECITEGLPIKLYVAAPASSPASQLLDLHRQAKRRGIGVVEVDGSVVRRQHSALSLSHFDVRKIDVEEFPKACRAQLTQARETFQGGDPSKGCSQVYDLIERCSRAIALNIDRLGLWRSAPPRKAKPKSWFRTGPWARVLGYVDEHANFDAMKSSIVPIDHPLWASIRGLTPPRNESGHDPATLAALKSRDKRLRTRFEHAVDVLADIVSVCPDSVKR